MSYYNGVSIETLSVKQVIFYQRICRILEILLNRSTVCSTDTLQKSARDREILSLLGTCEIKKILLLWTSSQNEWLRLYLCNEWG